MAALFAATHPERTASLVLYGAWPRILRAPDFPFGPRAPSAASISAVTDRWGDGVALSSFAPSLGSDPHARESWARLQRAPRAQGWPGASCSSTRRSTSATSCRQSARRRWSLHRTGDVIVPVGWAIPGGAHPGRPVRRAGGRRPSLGRGGRRRSPRRRSRSFVTGELDTSRRAGPDPRDDHVHGHRRLDGAGSRSSATRPGATLLEAHHAAVRTSARAVPGQWRSTPPATAFSSRSTDPARAIRCAMAIRDAVRALGLEIRAGLHTGECEKVGDKLTGIAVNIGARVGALAGSGDVLVSSTVVDLVAGSGHRVRGPRRTRAQGNPGRASVVRGRGLTAASSRSLRLTSSNQPGLPQAQPSAGGATFVAPFHGVCRRGCTQGARQAHHRHVCHK